jgi:NCAIR mutase (PurE)-related protein
MNEETRLRTLLGQFQTGDVSVEDTLDRLRDLPFEDLGFARIDHHRALRRGVPETVFCQGKTPEQVALIIDRLAARAEPVLATRASLEAFQAVRAIVQRAKYHSLSQVITVGEMPAVPDDAPFVLVVTAGTSDLPVAEEAALTARACGSRVEFLSDVGVAGLHRLLEARAILQEANVIVVVAGMEGALPSVVGGLVSCPVIAVPTSVGYGASFGGLSALLGMLNSCSPGITVVNIDNGYGAGYSAHLINQQREVVIV